MEIRQWATAAEWLAATAGFRASDPILTNVMGSVAEGVVAGTAFSGELWLTVEHAGDVIGCAIHTAPWPALVSPMADDAALALGQWLATHHDEVRGLTGPIGPVEAGARAMGRTPTVRMRQFVRVLGSRAPAPQCPGEIRAASHDDLPLLVEWFAQFHAEAGLPVAADEARVRSAVAGGRLWLWLDGPAVAMGGHAVVVDTPGGTVGRIGPIFTAPGHRRSGYGSALTHAIAVTLSSRCDRVMLYADAANPGSNRVYERLGFESVAEVVEAEFR